MIYKLPELLYKYNALEPYIDAQTLEIHYSKHHQTYVNNLNTVLEKYPVYKDKSIEEMLAGFDKLEMEAKDKTFFRNNAGGVINHNLYWKIMGPSKEVDEMLDGRIRKEFGSVEEFKKSFSDLALKHFGSGWAWLAEDDKGKLMMYSLPNQDSPFLNNHNPLICLDVWEHAYYLKYQNRRTDYISAWWNVLKII